MNIRDEITARIIAELEKGAPPWRRGWSAGGLNRNAGTDRPYHGINQLLLGMSGFADDRWLTLRQANAAGLRVRKGEKGTRIVKMVEVSPAESKAEDDVVAEDSRRRLVMRSYTVFNASQIDGMPPAAPKSNAVEPVAAAQAILDGLKADGLTLLTGGDKAFYSPRLDVIRLPEARAFDSTHDFWATALHEAAHSTGSPKRMNRPLAQAKLGSPDYALEELRVELSAAMLCAETGVPQCEAHMGNHAAYIDSWLNALRRDKNAIFTAAADAQRMSDWLREHALKPQVDAVVAVAPASTAKPSRVVEWLPPGM